MLSSGESMDDEERIDDKNGKEELKKRIEELKKEIEKKNEEIKKLEDEKNRYYEQMMRTAADMDNYRKYMEKEMKKVIESANEDLIKSLIDVLEDLERAVKAIKKDCGDAAALGIDLIYKQFFKILNVEGLKVIESTGRNFNPEIHEVVSVIEDKSKKNNVIIEEVRKGYVFKDKLIRPSAVIVNKLKEVDAHGKNNWDRPRDEQLCSSSVNGRKSNNDSKR